MPHQTPDLEEAFFEADSVRWRKLFPWLRLGETVRLALDPRKVLLAAIGVVVFVLVIAGVNQLPFAPSADLVLESDPAKQLDGGRFYSGASSESEWSLADATEAGLGPSLLRAAEKFGANDVVVRTPLGVTLAANTVAGVAFGVTRLLAGLFVWALFGGAIARMTALQFAGDHPTSLVSSLRYSLKNLLASVSGPLLPVSGLFAIWILIYLGGWVARVPAVGPVLAAIFWGLALLFAFAGALLLVGVCVAWPLMITGIAAEGTDAFDTLSRGFSYVFSRPIYLAGMLLVTLVIGVTLSEIIIQLAGLTGRIADDAIAASGATGVISDNAGVTLWWRAVMILASSFSVAYAWVAATVIYFLLRLSVDAMPLDRVFVPDDGEVDDLAPLVGVAATERREKHRAEEAAATNTDDSVSSGSSGE